jgi:hypothetical protein
MSNNTKGFEIAFNLQAKILRLRAWGKWDEGLKKKCEMALRDKIIELSTRAHWQIWYVLVDFTQFLGSSKQMQEAIEHELTTEKILGIKKIAYVQNNSIIHTPLPHERDGPRHSVFRSNYEALQWLFNRSPRAVSEITTK